MTTAPFSTQNQPEPDERKRREERILDAAAVLLVRWGYRKTTIDDVAREAGVGKGTIYLHWKDKSELFRAAIWRASQQATDDMLQRIADDPEGGRFYRQWAHGMFAVFANPLLMALMRDKPDILQGFIGTLPPALMKQLVGNAEGHIAQLQQAGLIRSDLPIPVMTLLMSALKMGIAQAFDLLGQEYALSIEQITDGLSDLIRRWLEPEHPPADSTLGKQIMTEWVAEINEIEQCNS